VAGAHWPIEVQLTGGPDSWGDRARALAATGVDGLFTFEGQHDVFFPLVVAAATGCDVDLSTNVAIAFPRSPIHLAHAAWDLQRLTAGRFRLGLGSQVRAQIERRYGAAFDPPVPRLRDHVLAVKEILAAWEEGRRPDHRGPYTTHTLMTPNFDPGPNPFGPPPILVGALGPRMTAMAAEVADGVLVMPFNSARHLATRTVPAIERGLDRGGRDRTAIEVVGEVIVAGGRDDAEQQVADAGVRWLLAFYGSTPSYRPVLDAEGWGDLQPTLNVLSKQGEWPKMADLITDEMIGTIAVRGTPAACGREIVARFGRLADRISFYLPFAHGDDLIAEVVAGIRAAAG